MDKQDQLLSRREGDIDQYWTITYKLEVETGHYRRCRKLLQGLWS